jgi:hypothetical protein
MYCMPLQHMNKVLPLVLLEPKTFFSNIPSRLSYDLFLAYFNLKDVKSGVISSNVR